MTQVRYKKDEKNLEIRTLENHLVIYGWKPYYKVLLDELHGEGISNPLSIVIIQKESFFLENQKNIYVLHDSNNHEKNLLNANLSKASQLILALDKIDQKRTPLNSFALLLSMLAKKINPHIRILASVPLEDHLESLEYSGIDEVLCGENLCSMIIANSLINSGIFSFLGEVLSTQYGNEFYIIPFGATFYNQSFEEALEDLKEKKNILLMAVMRGDKIYTNPHSFTIQQDDLAIVLAEKKVEVL